MSCSFGKVDQAVRERHVLGFVPQRQAPRMGGDRAAAVREDEAQVTVPVELLSREIARDFSLKRIDPNKLRKEMEPAGAISLFSSSPVRYPGIFRELSLGC